MSEHTLPETHLSVLVCCSLNIVSLLFGYIKKIMHRLLLSVADVYLRKIMNTFYSCFARECELFEHNCSFCCLSF